MYCLHKTGLYPIPAKTAIHFLATFGTTYMVTV